MSGLLPVRSSIRELWGMRWMVSPEAPGGRYTATVTLVDRVIDAASGTFGVRLELPNPNLAIPAGAKCKVRFKH